MNIIVVEDEEIVLEGEVGIIRRCAPDAVLQGFSSPEEALEHLRVHAADVAFLDLEMPQMHGLTLARHMKAIRPRLNIIFATAYPEYAESALQLRVSGYLLKPIKAEQIKEELENLRYPVIRYQTGLFVRAFGNFEVFYNGSPVLFRYNKTKELFAYLIDRRGALVSRDELITVLWGGETDRANYYKQVQKDLNDVFTRAGKECALVKQRGSLGLRVDLLCCDYYDWLRGLPEGLNAFMGEYMRQYDWAEATLVNITKWGGRGGKQAMTITSGVLDLFCAGLGLMILLVTIPVRSTEKVFRLPRIMMILLTVMLASEGTALCFFNGNSRTFPLFFLLTALSLACFYSTIVVYTLFLCEEFSVEKGPERTLVLTVNAEIAAVGYVFWCINCVYPFFFDITSVTVVNPVLYRVSSIPGIVAAAGYLVLIFRHTQKLWRMDTILLMVMPLMPLAAAMIGQLVPGLSMQYPLLFACLILMIIYHEYVAARKMWEKDEQLQHTHMRMALERVKPHYVYNVLSTIYYLCEKDAAKAQEIIGLFSDYLRDVSRSMGQTERVPFLRVLELIENYLRLEQTRFEDQISVTYYIMERDFCIPPFTVQPLVENAVKHGMAGKDRVRIWIESCRVEGGWQVVVRDDGVGFSPTEPPADEPSGLRNIRELLRLRGWGTLTIDSGPGRGTCATLFFCE